MAFTLADIADQDAAWVTWSATDAGTYTPVSSSWLLAIEYHKADMDLFVWFKRHDGGVTKILYPNIPPETVVELLNAPSKGRWVNEVFKQGGQPYRVVG